MEMFNQKVSKERIGALKKSKALDPLRDVERYFIKQSKRMGWDYSYDVLAQEMPYFNTMSYTEYATCFMMHPLNLEMRVYQIQDAYLDKHTEQLDYVNYFKDNIEKKIANKYQDRNKDVEKYKNVDNIVVLAGSNKLKENICLNKLMHIKREHDDNVYFKPHPITTYAVIGELKDLFGEETILPRDIDLYHFLNIADKVYTTHISESAMYAAALGKEIEPIDVYNSVERGSFYHINRFLFEYRDDPIEFINRVFSSYKSGMINPNVDKDWKEKLDQYFEYMKNKRNKYKGWYIEDKK